MIERKVQKQRKTGKGKKEQNVGLLASMLAGLGMPISLSVKSELPKLKQGPYAFAYYL